MRLVNRRTLEHAGACPFCGGDHRSDRFHVWLERGKERFWCRACNSKGPLRKLLGDDARPRLAFAPRTQRRARAEEATPVPAHQAHYRALYASVALWAHGLLRDPANPDPLAYLHQRGLDDRTIDAAVLGVTLRDPAALADMLTRDYPELLPYAEEAGVLTRDHAGQLRAHANLCGCLVFPYIAGREIVDLRTRTYPGKGYKSLPGGYTDRGARFPFGWDALDDTDTVILTEGEFKALAVTQGYLAGRLSVPALAHPGLSYLREEWPALLLARGVRTVILAYDSQRRAAKDGVMQLAAEETWTIRHGQRLEAAGLGVRALRLPLAPGQDKADLDSFLLEHNAARLQHAIDAAPTLAEYHSSLPLPLLQRAGLPLPGSYPLRRARPQRLELPPAAAPAAAPSVPLAEARAQIIAQVRDHALGGQGFLVLAHPPGAGKGHNTTLGLTQYLQAHPTPGQIVWTALRKDQIHDQRGLQLVPLHGRNQGNCRKFGEAQALSARGYSVRETLCQRRCPHLNSCSYIHQFAQEADFFASMPLMQATTWWQDAGVVVLDEFDPARLSRIVALTTADLAAIARATTCAHAQTVLGWVARLAGDATDRAIAGGMLLAELEALASADGLELLTTVQAAIDALPPEEEQYMLPGFPRGATLLDYENLPPNYLTTLLHQLAREGRKRLTGSPFTSRLEVRGGRLWLYLRIEHLVQQLARPEQPKVLLDATVNANLLRAIFPNTPIQLEQPRITGSASVIQVISRDWAKSGLRGKRRERWYDEVAQAIRPGRPTLIVCTQACEEDLKAALRARGHDQVVVAHYGALRGYNAFKGFDIVLAQVYHPNLEAIVREGRALFADDPAPLDEQVVTTDRVLQDGAGVRWAVQVPTFADARLAALLENKREAELVQAALRGRPFDHPEARITLMFGLPLPSLPPTIVREGEVTPASNAGRQATTRAQLVDAARQLLDRGIRVIGVDDLAAQTGVSVVTIRKHWMHVAARLQLRSITQRRAAPLARGGTRLYERQVLVRRGRWVPPPPASDQPDVPEERAIISADDTTDQARNMASTTRLIHRPSRITAKIWSFASVRTSRAMYGRRGKLPPRRGLRRHSTS